MIRPYLRDIINYHKTQEVWKVHLDNKVIDYKTSGEWKTQLSMTINFVSSKDSDEIRTMMVMKQMKLLKNFLNLFCKDIKKD